MNSKELIESVKAVTALQSASGKVIESWKLVTAMDNYEEVAGEILFRK